MNTSGPLTKSGSQLPAPTLLLYTFFLISQTARGIYAAWGVEELPALPVLFAIGATWIFGWWLRRDLSAHRIGWIFDMGMFLGVAWPVILPYYLYRNRGAKAFLIILAFMAVLFIPPGVGGVVQVATKFSAMP